jgi:D-amino-acid oxidase
VVMRESIEVHRRPAGEPWWRSAVPELTRARDCRPATSTPGASGPRWSRCRSISSCWCPGCRWPAAGSPAWRWRPCRCTATSSSTARAWAAGCSRRPRCASRTGAGAAGAQFGLDRVWLADGPLYVVPRSADVVVGGTADVGSGTGARTLPWRWTSWPGQRVGPGLAAARGPRHRVGLRPARERSGSRSSTGPRAPRWCTATATVGRRHLVVGLCDEVASLVTSATDAA